MKTRLSSLLEKALRASFVTAISLGSLSLVAGSISYAVDGNWIGDSDSEWNGVTNWEGMTLPSEDGTANFTDVDGTTELDITLQEDTTVGKIILNITGSGRTEIYKFIDYSLTTGSMDILAGSANIVTDLSITDATTGLTIGKEGALILSTVGTTDSISGTLTATKVTLEGQLRVSGSKTSANITNLTIQGDAGEIETSTNTTTTIGTLNITSTSTTGVLNNRGSMTITGTVTAADHEFINEGSLTIESDANIGNLIGEGTFIIDHGATVTMDNINAESATDDSQQLEIGENSSLTLKTDSVFESLESDGTVDMGTASLTIATKSSAGGTIKAGTLTTAAGSAFTSLTLNEIYITGTISTNTFNLRLEELTALTAGTTITLGLEALENETLSEGSYLLIDQKISSSSQAVLEWGDDTLTWSTDSLDGINQLIRTGHKVSVTDINGDIRLIVNFEEDRGWVTSDDYAFVPGSEEKFGPIYADDAAREAGILADGDVFTEINKIYVDVDTLIDLKASGLEELTLKNVSGDENVEFNIVGESAAKSTITFYNINPDGTDEEYIVHTLQSTLNLENVTFVVDAKKDDASIQYLSEVNLVSSTLKVTDEPNLYIESLNGDVNSVIASDVIINGVGGEYVGSYEAGSTVTIVGKDSSASFIAHENLTVSGGSGTLKLTSVYNSDMGKIATSGANVVLQQNEGSISTDSIFLQEKSTMTSGSLTIQVDGQALITGALDESPILQTVFEGESISLKEVEVIIENVGDSASIIFGENDPEKDIELLILSSDSASSTDDSTVSFTDIEMAKKFTNGRVEDIAGQLIVVADRNTSFYLSASNNPSATGNAKSGYSIMQSYYDGSQETTSSGSAPSASIDADFAAVMKQLDQYIVDKNLGAANDYASAIAGSSITAIGSAFKGDMDRQLRVIRDRASNMSRDNYLNQKQATASNGFWMEATTNNSTLDQTDYSAGHELSSWGASIGYERQLTNSKTIVGVAFTALYGTLDATAADTGSGDLNNYYFSAYAHINSNRWTHSFAAIIGMADATMERTLATSTGVVTTDGSTSGMAYGLVYELGYIISANHDASTIFQPIINLTYQSTSIDGYTENGGAGLTVDSQDLNYFSFGVGLRYETTVGGQVFNRHSTLSLRALAKYDSGGSQSETSVALVAGGHSATIKGAEAGDSAYELGASLRIPISASSNLYLDAATEMRDLQTQFNGTIGLQFSF